MSGEWLFFDNVEDPYQLNNLAGNPTFKSIAKDLEVLLSRELDRLNDEFLPGSSYIKKWGHNVDSTGTVPYKK